MFRFVEHQADIAVELEAGDRKSLFRNGLEAVIALLTGVPDGEGWERTLEEIPKGKEDIFSIKGDGYDDEERLVNLLNELLNACQIDGWWPLEVESVNFSYDDTVRAWILGVRGQVNRYFVREIKAATYHNLKIDTGAIWRTKVVFDV